MSHLGGHALGNPRHLRDKHEGQRQQRIADARPQRSRQRNRQQDGGKGIEHIHGAHNHGIGFAARIAGDNPDGPADKKGEHHRDNSHKQRQSGAKDQPRQHVASQLIRAQREAVAADGFQAQEHRRLIRIFDDKPRTEQRQGQQQEDHHAHHHPAGVAQ